MLSSTGSVRGFGHYNAVQLSRVIQDLGLSMSPELLSFCAAFYRNTEKRDPLVVELRMLDRLAKTAYDPSASVAITELYTNDGYIAQTYADMMRKRHELKPQATAPVTITEAAEIATAYLERSGKKHNLPGYSLWTENTSLPGSVSDADSVGVHGSSFRLQVRRNAPRNVGMNGKTLFLLFVPAKGISLWQYRNRLNSLLAVPEISQRLRAFAPVGNGLISCVLRMTEGAMFDLCRLSDNGSPVPLSYLTDRFAGNHIAAVVAADAEAVIKTASGFGIRAFTFATGTDENRFLFGSGSSLGFSLPSAFLRALYPIKPMAAKLTCEGNAEFPTISRVPVTGGQCAYLHVEQPEQNSVEIGGLVVSAASVAPQDGFYRGALFAVLSAVLGTALSCGDSAGIRLSLVFRLPDMTDSLTVGESISTILGVYRVQTELGIPAASVNVVTDSSLTHPELTVFACAVGARLPSRLTSTGADICGAHCDTDENGLPRFNLLRSQLTMLCGLRRNGQLTAAHILCGESLTAGLEQIRNDLFCKITNLPIVTGEDVPLAVIAETGEPFADLIGTAERVPVNTAPDAGNFLPCRASLVWSEKPEIVLLATPSDANAQTLAAILTRNGAEVRLFHSGDGQEGPLSRAILCAQILIFCGDVSMPDSPYFRFASETLLRSGGYHISVGKKTGDALPAEYAVFPDGIPEQLLRRLCEKSSQTDSFPAE